MGIRKCMTLHLSRSWSPYSYLLAGGAPFGSHFDVAEKGENTTPRRATEQTSASRVPRPSSNLRRVRTGNG